MIAVDSPVPDDIQPAEVDLLVTAILLRAGLYAEAIPGYDPDVLAEGLARIAERLTYDPLRRAA